jgi:hypothetical protein
MRGGVLGVNGYFQPRNRPFTTISLVDWAPNVRSVFRNGFIRVAVQPAFARLSRSNNRMTTRVCVFTGVLIRRAVAAKRRSTCLTRPQMHPVVTDLHALFAFPALRLFDGFDRIQMGTASGGHDSFTDLVFVC